jgi:hypothetical protein
MMLAQTCIGFHVECGNLVKGSLGVLMGFVLFVGSVLLLVSAVFGRKLGYFIVAVSFFAWLMLFSALWTFGFFSQGPKTPVDLGPRGREPGWVIESAGQNVTNLPYPQYRSYPTGDSWKAPTAAISASVQSVSGAIQSYLALQADEKAGLGQFAPGAFQTTDFTVQNVRFAAAGHVSLAAAQAYYNGGGPLITLYLRHDSGSVPIYSWMFLIGSIVGFAVHLPFLDRAERERKDILTGGTAPPWYGPA